ncbi:MAG: hypothetical protein GC168_08150 [Candidatus Hydrogenedens sp.]|nr:hypothetical protein [Candidatus Hydrogenedens sp.]
MRALACLLIVPGLTLPGCVPRAAAECLQFDNGISTGPLSYAPLAEISGIAASRSQPGVLWAHADSGDGANLYALDHTGALLAVYTLDGVNAIDWEDIAIAPAATPGAYDLYIADTGDNTLSRNSVVVYRVPEPIVPGVPSETPVNLPGAEALAFTYPDAKHDCEALMVDPTDGALYLVSKDSADLDGGFSYIYTPASTPTTDSSTELVEVASLFFGTSLFQKATAADIDEDGAWLGIRIYGAVYGWPRPQGTTIAEALATPACDWPLLSELQGESFAFDALTQGYYTASERNVFGVQKLHYYALLSVSEGEGTPGGEGMAEGEGMLEGELPAPHNGDTSGDEHFDLQEVLRIVQLYNAGAYACVPEGETEDGFVPGVGGTTCTRHDSDYAPPPWEISLSELLRTIQLYRIGGYRRCGDGEDGFCAG